MALISGAALLYWSVIKYNVFHEILQIFATEPQIFGVWLESFSGQSSDKL